MEFSTYFADLDKVRATLDLQKTFPARRRQALLDMALDLSRRRDVDQLCVWLISELKTILRAKQTNLFLSEDCLLSLPEIKIRFVSVDLHTLTQHIFTKTAAVSQLEGWLLITPLEIAKLDPQLVEAPVAVQKHQAPLRATPQADDLDIVLSGTSGAIAIINVQGVGDLDQGASQLLSEIAQTGGLLLEQGLQLAVLRAQIHAIR